MEKYVDSKVWLTVPGGVVGWDLLDINAKIDEFNSLGIEADFFDYLTWAEDDGNIYQGFSVLWNSKLMADVHTIRKI